VTVWTPTCVPHGGDGTQTIVVAVELDQDVIDDPSRHAEVIDRITAEARTVLADAAGVLACLVCARTKDSTGSLERHLSYSGHREEHELLAEAGADGPPPGGYVDERRASRPLRTVPDPTIADRRAVAS
jgi:hypothetical protein